MPDDHNECHLHSQQEAWHHIVIDMSMAQKGLNCVDIHFKFGCVSKHIGRCIYICWYNAWQWYQDINVDHTCIYNTQIQHYIAWEHQTFLLLNITITRSFLFIKFVRCYVSELVIVYILHIKLMFIIGCTLVIVCIVFVYLCCSRLCCLLW